MADEKKKKEAEVTEKKAPKVKKPSKFNPKNIWAAIKRWFKDLKGETKKIVWPSRQMVIKSTGVVLASIIVIGAGIWIIDFAISGAVTGVGKIADASKNPTTEVSSELETEKETEAETEVQTEADSAVTEKATEAATSAGNN